MSYPAEAITRRKTEAKSAKKAAADRRSKLQQQGLRRIELWATGNTVAAVEKAKAGRETLSDTINRLVGKDGGRIAELVALERQAGVRTSDEIDPERLAADLIEFMTSAGHVSMAAAVEDLIARAVLIEKS